MENRPRNSILICKDFAWEFQSVSDSREILEYLLNLYWMGLSKPMYFFPETSFEYAKKRLIKQKSAEVSLTDAQKVWTGSDYHRGESQDFYYDRCFGKEDPLDETFKTLSMDIFSPLFEHCMKSML